jgi:hypothetical protein
MWSQRSREFESGLCDVEPQPQPSKSVDGALKKVRCVRLPCNASDTAAGECARCLDAFSSWRIGERLERRRRSSRIINALIR